MALDHLGISIPDATSARAYYDALMPLVGFEPLLSGDDWFSYALTGGNGVLTRHTPVPRLHDH